jgi:hypothetical protein
MAETIFQHFIIQEFILPFLLVFTIVFAILEKTKILGDGKKRLDAIVAFVIGLIFVGAIFPKTVVNNLILFLTVALVIVFVIMLIWGFIFGDEKGFVLNPKLKWILGAIAGISVVVGVIWAVGGLNSGVFGWIFNSSWSSAFWTNFFFVLVISVALAVVLSKVKSD